MQVSLDISTIFVEYAHFYVNAIMLTIETKFEDCFAYFNYNQDVVVDFIFNTLDVVLQ